jgi:hypothetical protein
MMNVYPSTTIRELRSVVSVLKKRSLFFLFTIFIQV